MNSLCGFKEQGVGASTDKEIPQPGFSTQSIPGIKAPSHLPKWAKANLYTLIRATPDASPMVFSPTLLFRSPCPGDRHAVNLLKPLLRRNYRYHTLV